MITWKLETRKIKDLKEHPKNPRQISQQQGIQLQNSLENFGIIEKPIINKDNMIIGGHQRLKMLKKMGIKEISCWIPDEELTEEQVDELCIRLNKNTGTFDEDVLGNSWEPGKLLEWGFETDEIFGKGLFASDEPKEKKKKTKNCPHCGEEI